jgi:hypothetical protein
MFALFIEIVLSTFNKYFGYFMLCYIKVLLLHVQ